MMVAAIVDQRFMVEPHVVGERPQLPVDAHDGVVADLQVHVRGALVDGVLEQLVDVHDRARAGPGHTSGRSVGVSAGPAAAAAGPAGRTAATGSRRRTGRRRSGRAAACRSASRTVPAASRGPAAARGCPSLAGSPPPAPADAGCRPRPPPGGVRAGRPGWRRAGRGRRGVAAGDVRRHRLQDDVADGLGDLRVVQPRRRGELAAHQPLEVARRRRLVGQPAGQQLVHRDAERVDVGGEDRLAVELLGRHVGRAADDRRAVGGDLEEARGAEVGDLGDAGLGDQDVARAQVAVDDALADARGRRRCRSGRRSRAPAARSSAPSRSEIASSVSPGTYSITMKKTSSMPLGGEHGDDVGMAERRQQARLAQQLAEVEALAVRHLERDLLVDPGVFGEEDRAEAAAAERRQDLVLADDLVAKEHPPAV